MQENTGYFTLVDVLFLYPLIESTGPINMAEYSKYFMYTGILENFNGVSGEQPTFYGIYSFLSRFIGGAPGMPFLDFTTIVVEHFINYIKYTCKVQGWEAAMKAAVTGLLMFKDLKMSDEQLKSLERRVNTVLS